MKTFTKVILIVSLVALILGIIMLILGNLFGIMFIFLGALLPTIPLREKAREAGKERREKKRYSKL